MDSRFRGNEGEKTNFTETWMTPRQPAVYIMASGERGTLYIGVTGNLRLRVWEHRDGVVEGFTRRYGVKQLGWFEFHPDFPSAITRETQLKRWNRAWKLELVEAGNPQWRDLWEDLL
ncbi:GIY-YIG nuclease family protein [Rhodanobacter sp. FDAARGOS 1247]|uniref:GIY-YIG nuclease family protein n=1 Tax=Rhodanobacter sp. FDAARGOS 1247 TaxID=2778082 RepID=UPI001EF46003|nr:GIY-YIG nuclease family protein [Rhodanobacter sp. FDAARGOS 1247]